MKSEVQAGNEQRGVIEGDKEDARRREQQNLRGDEEVTDPARAREAGVQGAGDRGDGCGERLIGSR